ncbi:MAG: Uma2 family endonuclease [Caldilineaceae bacterium]|nr:Uma2 family endonuclease [Caldilineaceae bacterium]
MTSRQQKASVPIREIYPAATNGHHPVESWESLDGVAVTEDVYWAHYYDTADVSYEWNNGILEEKPVSDYRTVTIYRWFLMLLHAYLEVNPIAKLLLLETGFRLALPDKTTIRKPDLFVVRDDNPVPMQETDRSFRGICDLCVEALSDSTRAEAERDTVVKKQEYAQIGVKEYYILDWDERTAFYRRTPAGAYERIQPDAKGVLRSEVLPGFQFRVADLLTQPTPEDMAEDPVYRHFVLLRFQAVKERAEVAEDRAEVAEDRAAVAEDRAAVAEDRAAAERLRAERYAAKLRELGIEEL